MIEITVSMFQPIFFPARGEDERPNRGGGEQKGMAKEKWGGGVERKGEYLLFLINCSLLSGK